MTFTVERAATFRRQTALRSAAVAPGAVLAVLALSLGAGEARAQTAVCTPTQTVSAAPDADGRYTTTLTCANTAAAPTAADYRHLHYNQDVYSETHSNVQHTNPADRDTGLANNAANNNLAFTVESGVVFTADGGVDTRIVPRDGAVVLWGGGSKTVRIKRGATINLNRSMGPSGSANYPHAFNDILDNFGGIYAESEGTTGGSVAVLHEGKINVDITTNSLYSGAGYYGNRGSAITAVIRDYDHSETRAARVAADVRVDLASTGVIEQSAGSHSLGGIYASSDAEDGDVVVNLAKGSRIDLSVGGNPAVLVVAGTASYQRGVPVTRLIVNAAGTIRNRVPNAGSLSADMGLGIRAWNVGTGETRIESSGTIETVQASGIAARALNRASKQRDDPATSRIEGNLIDVTSGKIVTRAGTAVSILSDNASVWTVRVAEGAIVRSEFDGGPGAIPQATLGHNGGGRVYPGNIRSFRRIDANNDGNVGNVGDLLEPFVNAITINRSPCDECVPPKGVVDRVIVDGTAQTVGSRHGDAVIVFGRGFAAVTVGPTGRVISDSGSAIASGDPGQDAATTGDLSVTVARGGQVTGDIRVVNDGDLDATVSGTVDGNIRALGDGDLDATVSGTVTGEIRTLGAGNLTVTVGPTGRVLSDSGIAIASGQTPAALQDATMGGLSVTVARGGTVTGDVRVLDDGNLDATVSGTVDGDLRTVGAGHLNATVAGTVTGQIRTMGAGDLTVTVAEGGRLASSALHTAGGDLDLTVAGRLTGDLRPPRYGALTLSVLEGGVVPGTVHDPADTLTVAGDVGGVFYSNGGKIMIAATGRITGIETDSGTGASPGSGGGTDFPPILPVVDALYSASGTLDVTVAGRVASDLRPPAGGTLKLSVLEGGVVEGTVHDPEGPLTVAGGIERLLYSNGGKIMIAATGRITGIETDSGTGASPGSGGGTDFPPILPVVDALYSASGTLDVTVAGRVASDLRPPAGGTLKLSVLEGGVVEGTVHDPEGPLTVAGGIERLLYSNGGKVTVAATGALTGIRTSRGTEALRSDAGTLDATVAGRVAGDLRPPADGALKLSVLEGGVVEGTVHDPEGPLTVAGSIERLLYSNGGKVTVAATGALTGIRTSRGTEALRSDAGTLDATVAGRVAGDLRPPADGALKLSVLEGGVVEGTVHDPEGPMTVAGSIGRLFYSNGGEATIGATGALTGVDANGRIEALRSETGDLRMTVAGRAVGDILGLGDGEHDVIVRPGGVVTGAIRLAASTAQVDGAAGAVFLDRGGAVAVGPEGRIAGVGGVGIHSAAGDFTGTVEGVVIGDIRALGGGARTVDIQPGAVVTGDVYVPDGDSAGAAAVSVARGARVTGAVEVPRAENLELDGAVGKVSAVRGGVLTVGPDGRVTGTDDDTPDVSSETGELTVVIQLAPGETEADAVMRRAPRRIRDVSGDGRVLYRMPDSDELRELRAFESGYSTPSGPFDVGLVMGGSGIEPRVRYAPRAQVYEALPSVLLGLNEPSGFRARMAAPRASNGMWARTQAWTGARDAKRSTSTGPAGRISLKHRGYGLEAGMDIPLGDGALLSVSAHRRTVSADVSGGAGDINVVGNGVGASLAVDLADSVTEGAYADARVSATSYSARLSSGRRGSLQRDADGVGHAVSLEAGRRMAWGEGALGETTLTPRALFLYSRVDMDAFTDSVGARVSLKEGVSKTGRAGLRVEAVDRPGGSLLFASVDVEREFAPETRVQVSGFPLESESESTRVRAEVGGALEWGEGAWALQAAARYASGADDYGGGVSLRMRF